MSLITHGELYNGALKSREAKAYSSIRSKLEKQGRIIGNNDLWIAAHAITLNLILVTNNTKEFGRIDGLKFENWV